MRKGRKRGVAAALGQRLRCAREGALRGPRRARAGPRRYVPVFANGKRVLLEPGVEPAQQEVQTEQERDRAENVPRGGARDTFVAGRGVEKRSLVSVT